MIKKITIVNTTPLVITFFLSACSYTFKVVPDIDDWKSAKHYGSEIKNLALGKKELSGASKDFIAEADKIVKKMDVDPKYLPDIGADHPDSALEDILSNLEKYQIFIGKRLETVKLKTDFEKRTGSDFLFLMQLKIDDIIKRARVWQKKIENYKATSIKVISSLAKVAAVANNIPPSVVDGVQDILSGEIPDPTAETAIISLLVKAQTDAKNRNLERQLSYLNLIVDNPQYAKASEYLQKKIENKEKMNKEKAEKISSFLMSQLYDFARKNPDDNIANLRKEFSRAIKARDNVE